MHPWNRAAGAAVLAAAAVLTACGGGGDDGAVPPVAACAASALPSGAASATFAVPGWTDRDVDLQLPASHRCGEPMAVAVFLHGGGGNRINGRTTTCPLGDPASADCFDKVALAAGMAVVFADGTKVPGSELLSPGGIRTWNAGGGRNGFNCVSGNACNSGVDDVAYMRALLDAIGTRVTVDPKRVFASGFSNGAAMAHRLACQAADRFAAVAPVSGQNQFALNEGPCAPPQRVAVLDVHGTADGCWPYAGGPGGCIENGLYVSVAATLADWAARNACAAPSTATLPAIAPADGTSVVRWSYACATGGALQHLRIEGGGHQWPRGFVISGNATGGALSRQLDANRAIVDWFAGNGRP